MKQTKVGIVLVLIFTLLVWTNPSDGHYLGRIAADYGLVHAGARLNHNDLLSMGTGIRKNYLIFSKYTYSFGDISVSYIGFFSMIYYTGSGSANARDKNSLAFL